MITGRFEVVGIRRFKELPKGALFVECTLEPWEDYRVEEGLLVYGAEKGQETPLLKKVKHGKYAKGCIAKRLDGGEERPLITPCGWVAQLKEVRGRRRVWMEKKISIRVTTFGQLAEGEAFIRVEDLGRVYRKKGELGVYLDGDNDRKISLLERVIPVYVGDIRSPEYVVIRILEDGPSGCPYPTKRSNVEDCPEHYEILEGGFPDHTSAAERAKQLWSEREELTADES